MQDDFIELDEKYKGNKDFLLGYALSAMEGCCRDLLTTDDEDGRRCYERLDYVIKYINVNNK